MDSRAKSQSPERGIVDNLEPPELIMFSLGPGLAPSGESIVNELIRLTPLTVYHISTDVTITESQWSFWHQVASESELSCLCLFESITLNDLCGTHSEENINSTSSSNMEIVEEEKSSFPVQWSEKVVNVLKAGHVNKEIIFVIDRSMDAGLKSAPHTSSDVYDCLDYLPHSLIPFFLPLLNSRPIILLPELARYSAAQCLNRIVELLPQDIDKNKNHRGSSIIGEVAPASFTSPQAQASSSSQSNHRKSVISPTSPKKVSTGQSNHRGSLRASNRHASITRRSSADAGFDINAEEEVAKRRAAFIRTYMEEKVPIYVKRYIMILHTCVLLIVYIYVFNIQ